MSEKVKNKIIVLEPSTKSLKELIGLITEKDLALVVPVKTPEEAFQEIVAALPCILMTSINDNQDVPSRVQMFKRLEAAVKHHGLKIYVVTPLKNRQLADMATQKLGVADYIVEPVPVRTMQFKINLQLKAVDNFRRQQEMKKASEEKIVIKKLDGKRAEGPAAADLKTNQKPALEAAEDTFLFKNSGVKKSGKKFTVELEGPDPETGEWVQHEDKGDAKTSWRWVPNEEKEKQASGAAPKDGWIHEGDKPVFSENSQKWAMTSENPSLSLKAKGQTVAKKLGVDEKGEVFVAEDSPTAEANIKKNRAKSAALKLKKDKKDPLGGEEKSEKDTAPAGAPGASTEPADAKDAATTKEKGTDRKKGAAKKMGPKGLGEDDDVELNDRTAEGEPAESHAPQDKRGPQATDGAAEPKLKEGGEKEKPAKGMSPLEFLKKKKETQRAGVVSIQADAPPEGVNPLQPGEEEENANGMAGAKPLKKRKNNAALLARLNESLKDTVEKGEEAKSDLPEGFGDDAEEEDDAPAAPKAAVAKIARSPAEPLRSDPADQRAELNDRQGEGDANKKSSKRREKKKTLEEINALLDSPLPDSLSAEEEEEIREELNLKGRPEITARDLVRKKRMKNAKELKSRLAELELEIAADEQGESVSGLSPGEEEKAGPTQGDLSPDKLRGIRQAIDSADEETEDEEAEKKRAKREEAKKKRAALGDESFYLPEAELLPLGNAWDRAGSHYAYLNATVRYKGFSKLEELLPLWVFEGEDVPQLLDKTKQWRFLGGRPSLAKTVTEIPSEVRDFLLGLRDQIKKNTETGASSDDAEPDEAESAESSDEEASGRKEKKKRREERKMPSLGKGVDELLSDSGNPASSRDDDSQAQPDAPEPEARDTSDAAMERLRAKLAGGEDTGSDLPDADANASAPDALTSAQSDGVQSFLERRKQKKERATPKAESAVAAERTPAPGLLGIYVAISDAYAIQSNPLKALTRILGALEGSFRNCVVFCTSQADAEGRCRVLFHSAETSPPPEVILREGLSAVIQRKPGGNEEVLGYLYLATTGDRKPLERAEEEAFRKVSEKLWPLVSQAIRAGETEKKAA